MIKELQKKTKLSSKEILKVLKTLDVKRISIMKGGGIGAMVSI